MEWHVTVFGSLAFPKGGLARWRKLEVDTDAFDDWKGELGAGMAAVEAVAAKLARFASYPELSQKLGRLEVKAHGARVQWRGFLQDDAFRGLATEVAATFRRAADAGGQGDLHFVHVGGEYAYRIHVEPGKSSCTGIRSQKKIEALAKDPLSEAADQLYVASFELPAEVGGAPPIPAAAQASPLAITGDDPWPAVVARLDALGAAAVYEALLARGGQFCFSLTQVEPVDRAFADGEAVLVAIRAGEPAAIKPLALELLRRLDAAATRQLAMRLLTADAPDDLLAAAALVLRQAGDGEAQVALARAIARPPLDERTPFRSMLVAAMATAPPEAVTAALELLDELADRPDAGDVLLVTIELALSRGLPVPLETAKALLSRSEPRLRELAASALLADGSVDALETLTAFAHEPGSVGRTAVRATFELDTKAAYDRLAPQLDGAAGQTVRLHLLGYLSDTVSASKKAPELREPRFVDVALGALDQPGAVTFLGYVKDARVPAALAAILPQRFEEVCEALKRIGDPSVLPVLEAAASQAPNPHCKKLVARTIQQLQKKAKAPAARARGR